MSILERVVDRRVVEDHDGRSGARIERGTLDGTAVYIKQAKVEHELAQLLTGDARREEALLHAKVFDDLPDGVGTALLAVEVIDGTLVTITRDLADAMLAWDRHLTRTEVERIFAGMAVLHGRFAGRPPERLCPLEVRISLFRPANLGAMRIANADLASAIERGQELFDDLVPAPVADAVRGALEDPGPLAAALCRAGTTLLHGDCWLVNLALEGEILVPLDWGLATEGPPVIDLLTFCLGATSNVDLSRDDLVALARQSCGDLTDDTVWALGEFWTLMELGWNKALDAIDHPDAAKRSVERADLDFWVQRAQRALDTGIVPVH